MAAQSGIARPDVWFDFIKQLGQRSGVRDKQLIN